jgi:hypothetical protein
MNLKTIEKSVLGTKFPMKGLTVFFVGIWRKKWKSLSCLEKQQNQDVSRT